MKRQMQTIINNYLFLQEIFLFMEYVLHVNLLQTVHRDHPINISFVFFCDTDISESRGENKGANHIVNENFFQNQI